MPPAEPSAAPPVIQLDETSAVPKYQQIVTQVRTLVAAGALAPGAPLPSVRQLATDLGINVNTVLVAYHALEAEQIVLARRGARLTIHPRLAHAMQPRDGDLMRIRSALERTRTDALLAGISPAQLRALASEVFSG
jgi:GntR family transcriptional regulator